jgi:glycosyltransferase involved in cell wall biosynthesis
VKILIFYQYFTTPKGSWGTRIYEFSKEWVKQGHEVTIVTSIYSKSDLKASKFIETQIIEGIKVKVLNIKIDNKQPITKRIFSFILYSIISTWYALTLKSDVAIASSGPITVGIPGLISKIFTKKKLVYEVRDLWPEVPIALGIIQNTLIKKIAFYFEKKLYANASLVVGLSPGIRDHIKDNFNHKNVISVTNSANLNLFGEKKYLPNNNLLNKNDFYGIYTGNIGKINNSFWLVNAARNLKKKNIKNIKIVMIGDGQLKSEITSIIKKEKLSNLIHFDLMPKERLVPFIQNANVSFVPLSPNPILDTSSPNKFFESLAAGVPVIQTTKGWIKDYIEINNVGFNLDGGNSERLSELLIKLKNNPEILDEMKQNSKKCSVRDFDQIELSDLYLSSLLKLQNK